MEVHVEGWGTDNRKQRVSRASLIKFEGSLLIAFTDTFSIELRASLSGRNIDSISRDAPWSQLVAPFTNQPVTAAITSDCSCESSTPVVEARHRVVFIADGTTRLGEMCSHLASRPRSHLAMGKNCMRGSCIAALLIQAAAEIWHT